MSELSRVEDLLKTGVEEPVLPMSRLEAILRGEKITPQSRVEELLLQYNPSDILIEKRITANGTYFAVNDNADGYFKVVVDTPVVPPSVLDHLVETITSNGLHEYTPTHDGFDTAAITVAVPSVTPVLDDITITENGVYTSEHDGFDEVTVNVSGGSPSGDINIKCAPLAWDNTVEGSVASCSISVVNNKLTYTWNGGEYITANSVYTVPVSKDASKVRFNITTGTSYYSTYSQLDGFKIRVGVRTVFDNGSINTDNINDWIDVEAFATDNSTFEGELDLRDLNTEGYIYIIAHGWNLVVNSVDVLYNTTVMLDPNYNYYTAKDGQIIVRVYHEGKSDEKIVWFFNGLEKTGSDLTVPSNLLAYAPPSGFSESVASQAMSPTKNESTYNYWIGWAHSLGNSVIRSWTNDWTATAQGTFWAVVDLDNGDEQTNKYTDPYVYIEVTEGGGEVIDISSLFGDLVVNAQFATGSWDNGVFSFDVDDYVNYWTSFVSLTSGQLDFTNLDKLSFDADIIDQQDYSELAVIISPVYYTWGSSDWPGIFSESNKVANYYTTSGSYEIDTHLITGNNYIYIIAYSSDHNHSGNEYNGLIEGTVSNICVTEAGSDSHIYLMDGQVPSQGTTYLEFDKPPINGYYVISIYANNKSFNNMVWFQTGQNSSSFDFSPGISGGYNCYIMWDNNKATVRIKCNSGSWYTMHVRVTRVDDNYILNS